jgi:hypothetical protein
MRSLLLTLLLIVLAVSLPCAQETTDKVIPAGSKVFVAPMENGFHDYLKAALQAKKVPLVVVEDKSSADFEISGHSETQKASTAKKVIMWDWRSNEQASIQIANLKTSQIVFAYSVNKVSSAHGKKSSAEACAKHIKDKVDSKK